MVKNILGSMFDGRIKLSPWLYKVASEMLKDAEIKVGIDLANPGSHDHSKLLVFKDGMLVREYDGDEFRILKVKSIS